MGKHVAWGLVLSGLAACAQSSSEKGAAAGEVATVDAAAVRQSIEAANARTTEAMTKGDVDGLLANYASDAVVMMPNEPAWRGSDALRSGSTRIFEGAAISDVSFHTEDVQVSGDLAVETGTFDWTLTPKGGKPIPDKGKYLTVWRKQADGSWKIIRDINNSSLPATTP